MSILFLGISTIFLVTIIFMYTLPPQYTCWCLGDVSSAMVKLKQPPEISGEIETIFPHLEITKYLCTKWVCLKIGYTPKNGQSIRHIWKNDDYSNHGTLKPHFEEKSYISISSHIVGYWYPIEMHSISHQHPSTSFLWLVNITLHETNVAMENHPSIDQNWTINLDKLW